MNKLLVPGYPKSTKISTDEIVRLEGSGNYTIFHMVDGRHFVTSKSLIYYEEILPLPFLRIHKSSLINIHFVLQRQTAGFVTMTDGTELPIARRRKPELRKHLKYKRRSKIT